MSTAGLLLRTKLDQPASRMSVKRVRGPGQQYQMDRGAMLALRGSANVHVLVNRENGVVCACTSELQSLPAEEEEGSWLSILGFYASPICRCCFRQCLVCDRQ